MAGLVKLSRLLVAVGLLAVAGCAPSAGAGGPTAVDGPAKSVTTPQREDKAFAKVVQAAGFDAGTAAFAVLTTSTVEVVNGHTYIVRQDFPNGATAATAIHLFSGGGGTPGQPPRVKLTSLGETAIRYTFSYSIATADLPADLRAQVLAGLPVGPPSQAQRDGAVAAFGAPAGGLFPQDQDRPTVIDAVVDGVMEQTVTEGIDKAIDTTKLDQELAHTSWSGFQAGWKAWIAFQANEKIKKAKDKIKKARECAEDPTNELTRKHYEENPGAKEELLRQLDEIANEVTASTVATLTAMFIDGAAGFIKAAPWLGFITGPAVNYITDTLDSVINEYVKAAEQMVTKCTWYQVTGDSQVSVEPLVIDGLGKPFTVKASKDGAWLTYTFTPSDRVGRAGSVNQDGGGEGWSIKGSGTYAITGADPGPYELKFRLHGCIDITRRCNDISHLWKITPFSGT